MSRISSDAVRQRRIAAISQVLSEYIQRQIDRDARRGAPIEMTLAVGDTPRTEERVLSLSRTPSMDIDLAEFV